MNTMTTPPIITLQPGAMSFADLRRVWLAPTPIALSGDCAAAIEASAATVQAIVAKGDPAYGINTGFGLLAKTQIPTHELERLQRNPVSYTHLTLPTNTVTCRSRWSPDH